MVKIQQTNLSLELLAKPRFGGNLDSHDPLRSFVVVRLPNFGKRTSTNQSVKNVVPQA